MTVENNSFVYFLDKMDGLNNLASGGLTLKIILSIMVLLFYRKVISKSEVMRDMKVNS